MNAFEYSDSIAKVFLIVAPLLALVFRGAVLLLARQKDCGQQSV